MARKPDIHDEHAAAMVKKFMRVTPLNLRRYTSPEFMQRDLARRFRKDAADNLKQHEHDAAIHPALRAKRGQ